MSRWDRLIAACAPSGNCTLGTARHRGSINALPIVVTVRVYNPWGTSSISGDLSTFDVRSGIARPPASRRPSVIPKEYYSR